MSAYSKNPGLRYPARRRVYQQHPSSRRPEGGQGYLRLHQAGISGQGGSGICLRQPRELYGCLVGHGAVVKHNAVEAVANKQAKRLITLLRRNGVTLMAIATELNSHGYRTQRGKEFHKTSVLRLLRLAIAMTVTSSDASHRPHGEGQAS